LLGFAGSVIERPGKDRVLRIRIACGIVLGNVLRLAAHFISGWVFFAEYAPEGQPVWLYSLSYNATYVIPETIACILLVQFIMRFVQRK
jgi:thiamine transporter